MKARQLGTIVAAAMISSASFAALIPVSITTTGDPSTGAGATITFNDAVNFTIENANSEGLIVYHFGLRHDVIGNHDDINVTGSLDVQKNGVDFNPFWNFQEARYDYDDSNHTSLWTWDTGGILVGDVITIQSGTTVTLAAGTVNTDFIASGTYYMWLEGNSGTLLAGTKSYEAIPEPATALSLVLGGLLITGYRRFFGRV